MTCLVSFRWDENEDFMIEVIHKDRRFSLNFGSTLEETFWIYVDKDGTMDSGYIPIDDLIAIYEKIAPLVEKQKKRKSFLSKLAGWLFFAPAPMEDK